MKEFKVGDEVTIRKKKWFDTHQTPAVTMHPGFVKDMEPFCGKKAKITEDFFNGIRFRIDIDPEHVYHSTFFEESNDCDFCKGDDVNLNGVHVSLSGKTMNVDNKSFEIEYCPFCGDAL